MGNMNFERYTRLYEDGDAYLPVTEVTLRGNGELAGEAITRFALYESLLQMEPAEAALQLLAYQKYVAEQDPKMSESLTQAVLQQCLHTFYQKLDETLGIIGKEDS